MKPVSEPPASSSDFLVAMVARGSAAPLALVANILIARHLGAETFGSYMVLLSTAYIFTGVALLGTDQVLLREVAAAGEGAGHSHLTQIGRWALRRLLGAFTLAAVVMLCWMLANPWRDVAPGAFEIGATQLVMLSSAAAVVIVAALAARGAIRASQVIDQLLRNGLLLLAVLIALSMAPGVHSVPLMLLAQAVSFSLACLVGWLWLRRRLNAPSLVDCWRARVDTGVGTQAAERNWDSAARLFFIGSISVFLLNRVDVLVVSWLSDTYSAGIYGAAVRLGQLVALVGHAGVVWLQPRVALYYRSGRHNELRAIILRGGGLVVGCSVLAGLVVFSCADIIVALLGPDFAAAAAPLRWIASGYLCWALAVPFFVLLTMTGGESIVARILWLQLVLHLVALVALVPQWGLQGASIAWFIALAVVSLLTIYQGLRKLTGATRPHHG